MAYQDLRDYLATLEQRGKLHRVTKPVDKDWEIAAVCRKVFQVIPSSKRPALLFERVKGHSIPVVAGVLGASREVYAIALETTEEKIWEKWCRAQDHPIPPQPVPTGPCKEQIFRGKEIDLTRFPIPIWTAHGDRAPYLTSPYVFSMDPETGVQNVGTYRVQVKGASKAGLFAGGGQHFSRHLARYERQDRPMPVAIVLGADPTIGLTSVAKIPYGVDELAVAGGLRGEPIAVVKAETSNLSVPATAEIVIEGEIPPHYREEEGPFGEYTGYLGPATMSPIVQITCITQRAHPIYQAFVSQMPPSESSCIRGLGHELPIFHHLHHVLKLPVKQVRLKESGGSGAYLVISIRKETPYQPRQVILAAWSEGSGFGKFTVVVDDDIDIHDDFAVDWALAFRVQPSRDIFIMEQMPPVGLDPSVFSAGDIRTPDGVPVASKIGIDATKKHPYPPIALPPQEHLEEVVQHWQDYGLQRYAQPVPEGGTAMGQVREGGQA